MRHRYMFLFAFGLMLLGSDVMAQTAHSIPRPSFQWRSTDGDSLLNFHRATTSLQSFDSIPYARDYTMVVVYKPVTDTEAMVWDLVFSDSIVRGLTTEQIVLDSTYIRYADTCDGIPVIHTLRQSAPDNGDSNVRLIVGDGNIMVSEVLYYDHRLGNAALRRIQSALAIRYGITLGPVDYIGGNGDHIWEHLRDSALFHHRITGIGCDTLYHLHQFESRSEMQGSIVIVSTDSLAQGAYLLFGDNDAPLTFDQGAGGMEVLARQWRVQAVGVDTNLFSFVFDTRNLPMPTDSLVLMMDGIPFLPTASSPNTVRFNNLWLLSDTCILTLARGTILWQMAQMESKGSNNPKVDMGKSNATLCRISPNPTTGRYKIEVSGTTHVRADIYDTHGRVVATFDDKDRESYCFQGSLPSGNIYYVTIVTEDGTQTMKLIVK